MMKNKDYLKSILLASMLISILSSCEKIFFQKTASGLAYKIIYKGAGPKPKDGEIMLFDMLCKAEKGDIILNSADGAMPFAWRYTDKAEKDASFQESASMLEKGDKAIFKINAKKFFAEQFEQIAAKHHLVDSTIVLVHMNIKDIMREDAYREWLEKQYQLMHAQEKEKAAKQLKIDIEIIDKYLAENKWTAQTTASGLRYIIDKPGQPDGKTPQSGNTVKVHYTGSILAGKLFDTSLAEVAKANGIHNSMRPYEPLAFQIGQGQVIPGWDEGIMLLTKGAKARLFIPSPLAYGSYSLGEIIKPNSILVFEVELVDIN